MCKNLCLLPVGLPLIGTVLRVLQHHSEGKCDGSSKEDAKDEQLQTLAEITAEFLADICIQIPKVISNKHFVPCWIILLPEILKCKRSMN